MGTGLTPRGLYLTAGISLISFSGGTAVALGLFHFSPRALCSRSTVLRFRIPPQIVPTPSRHGMRRFGLKVAHTSVGCGSAYRTLHQISLPQQATLTMARAQCARVRYTVLKTDKHLFPQPRITFLSPIFLPTRTLAYSLP